MAAPNEYQPSDLGPNESALADDTTAPLLVEGTAELQLRWNDAQAAFVDDPRRAAQEASGLVQEVLDRLARTFDDEQARLEATWTAGSEPSTEDLRLSLRRYREFFDRLLAA